jgi:tetratricopeptide (TPR) repeat protein
MNDHHAHLARSTRPRTIRRTLLAAATATWLAIAGSAHAQDPSADLAAHRAFQDGQAAYDSGRFDLALQQFERSYALSHRPEVLYSIGRAAEADGRNEHALRAYEAYVHTRPDARTRAHTQERIAALKRTIAASARSSAPNPWAASAQPTMPPPPSAPPAYGSPPSSYPGTTTPYASTYQPSSTFNDPSTRPVRLYGGLRLAVGGTRDWANSSEESDLKNAVGVQLGTTYVFPALPYLALGGEVRFGAIKVKGVDDRKKIWDFALKPRVRYDLKTLPLEIYAALPVGLSVLGDDVGANLGILGGVGHFFTDQVGVSAEMGWQMHWISADKDKGELKQRYGQWTLFAVNMVVAF